MCGLAWYGEIAPLLMYPESRSVAYRTPALPSTDDVWCAAALLYGALYIRLQCALLGAVRRGNIATAPFLSNAPTSNHYFVTREY